MGFKEAFAARTVFSQTTASLRSAASRGDALQTAGTAFSLPLREKHE